MADTYETTADIIAEMKREAAQMFPALPIAVLKLATRIEAAHKRERGDAAKLREALEKVIEIANKEWDASRETSAMWEIWEICKAALAAPPRNCDVHTADELKVIFNSELVLELPIANEHEKNLVTITAMGVIDTLFATTTEKEGKTK